MKFKNNLLFINNDFKNNSYKINNTFSKQKIKEIKEIYTNQDNIIIDKMRNKTYRKYKKIDYQNIYKGKIKHFNKHKKIIDIKKFKKIDEKIDKKIDKNEVYNESIKEKLLKENWMFLNNLNKNKKNYFIEEKIKNIKIPNDFLQKDEYKIDDSDKFKINTNYYDLSNILN